MPYTSTYAAVEPLRSDVDALPGITVVEFGAPWCGHCQGAQRAIASVLDAHPDVHHIKVEDGRGLPLGRSFRVKLWPTLVVLRDGAEIGRAVRPTDRQAVQDALEGRGGG